MSGNPDAFAFWGELAALGTAVLWSFASIVFTAAGRQIGAFNLNKLRIPIATLCLGILVALTGGFAQADSLDLIGLVLLGLSGVIGLAIGDSCYFRSLVILGPRRATLLMSAAPVIAALIAWPFLDEHLGAVAWLGIGVTLAGIVWVTGERSSDANSQAHGSRALGIALALGGAAGQAVGLVLAKSALVRSDVTPLNATLVRMAAATVAIWSYAAARGQIVSTLNAMKSRPIALAVIAGALLGPCFGVWLSLISVKHIEAGIAATIMATVPVLVLPLVILIHRERVSLRSALGALIAVGGVAMLFLR